MRRLLEIVGAVALAVTILGGALLPLLTPPFTAALSERYSRAEEAGLPLERMLQVAETVRAFVADGEGTLPATVDGRPAFDPAAVSHLEDVAAVMAGARIATFVALGAFLACTVVWWRRRDSVSFARALVWGGAGLLVGAVAAAVFGRTNFDAFFTWFHTLFFSAGTWTFPYDSLLIQLFPEQFWIVGGVTWGTLAALMSVVSITVGLMLLRRSRSANDGVV